MKNVFSTENIPSGRTHYVLTEDLHPLMHRWAEQKNFKIPNASWFARNHHLLRMELESVLNAGSRTVVVDSYPYYYMVQEMHPLIYGYINNKIWFEQVISADPVYTPAISCPTFSLEITRAVDSHGKAINGRVERPGHKSLEEQIYQFSSQMEKCPNYNRNALFVDDGIWTGETLKKAVQLMKSKGLNIVGVVIAVGANKDDRMIDIGIDNFDVHIVQDYDKNRPVEDWICERDFFLGVSYGGRTVVEDSLQREMPFLGSYSIGAFYPEQGKWLKTWASVGDYKGVFQSFCLERSVELFREIERLSGKRVSMCDLDRIPLVVAKALAEGKVDSSSSFVDFLETIVKG